MRTERQGPGPEISVLMTTYNRPHLIGAAIDSILLQSFRKFELIIVDASDNEETQKVVARYRDTRLTYVRRRGNIARGRNIGLRLARAGYVTYCDDDERYYRVRLAELKKFLDGNPEVGLAYTDTVATKGNMETHRFEYDFEKDHLEAECFFGVGSVMHRKQCIDKVGNFNERFTVGEDWDMWLRIADSFKIVRFSKILHVCLMHETNITLKTSVFARDYVRLVKKRLRKKAKRLKALKESIAHSSLLILRKLLAVRANKYAFYYVKKYCRNNRSYQSLACHGIYELSRGNFKRGIGFLKNAVRIIPVNTNRFMRSVWQKEIAGFVYFYLAQGYLSLDDVSSAVSAAKFARSYSRQQCITLLLAQCYMKTGKYKETLKWIGKCKGGGYSYLNLKGCCYLLMKKPGVSIRYFQRAIAFFPRFTIARYNLALSYKGIGDLRKSVIECKKIIGIDSKHGLAKKLIKECHCLASLITPVG